MSKASQVAIFIQVLPALRLVTWRFASAAHSDAMEAMLDAASLRVVCSCPILPPLLMYFWPWLTVPPALRLHIKSVLDPIVGC